MLAINFYLVLHRPTSLDATFLGHALFVLHALPVSSLIYDTWHPGQYSFHANNFIIPIQQLKECSYLIN